MFLLNKSIFELYEKFSINLLRRFFNNSNNKGRELIEKNLIYDIFRK